MSERTSRQSVSVEIAGERHTLRSDASPEYTQMVAAHLDATIRALGVGNTLDPHKAAILAALTITDELFRAREEAAQLRGEIARQASRLAEILERASAGAA
jgi:cell division protein ZapA